MSVGASGGLWRVSPSAAGVPCAGACGSAGGGAASLSVCGDSLWYQDASGAWVELPGVAATKVSSAQGGAWHAHDLQAAATAVQAAEQPAGGRRLVA